MAGPHEIHYGFLRTHLQVALKAGDVGASAESAPSSRNYNDANGGVELDFVQCPRDSGEQLVAEGVQLRRSVQRENRHSAAIVAEGRSRSRKFAGTPRSLVSASASSQADQRPSGFNTARPAVAASQAAWCASVRGLRSRSPTRARPPALTPVPHAHPAFLQNRLLAQVKSSRSINRFRILHGRRRRIGSITRSLRRSVSEQVTGAIWRIVSYKKPLAF